MRMNHSIFFSFFDLSGNWENMYIPFKNENKTLCNVNDSVFKGIFFKANRITIKNSNSVISIESTSMNVGGSGIE